MWFCYQSKYDVKMLNVISQGSTCIYSAAEKMQEKFILCDRKKSQQIITPIFFIINNSLGFIMC